MLNTACGNHAAAYLQAIPSEPALTLSNTELLVSVSHYLDTSHHVHVEAWSTEVAPDVYGVLDIQMVENMAHSTCMRA